MSYCTCVVKNREDGETQREWFKRWMCQYHWMSTDYYQNKLPKEQRRWDADTQILQQDQN